MVVPFFLVLYDGGNSNVKKVIFIQLFFVGQLVLVCAGNSVIDSEHALLTADVMKNIYIVWVQKAPKTLSKGAFGRRRHLYVDIGHATAAVEYERNGKKGLCVPAMDGASCSHFPAITHDRVLCGFFLFLCFFFNEEREWWAAESPLLTVRLFYI